MFIASSLSRLGPRHCSHVPEILSQSHRSTVAIRCSDNNLRTIASMVSSSRLAPGGCHSPLALIVSVKPFPGRVGMMLHRSIPQEKAHWQLFTVHSTEVAGTLPGGCSSTNARAWIPLPRRNWQASANCSGDIFLLSRRTASGSIVSSPIAISSSPSSFSWNRNSRCRTVEELSIAAWFSTITRWKP